MKLKTFLKAANYQIISSDKFLWSCYGPNAQFCDVYGPDGKEVASCVYDTVTNRVYEITTSGIPGDCYAWYDPKFTDARIADSIQRGLDPFVAYDDVHYNVLTVKKTMLATVNSVVTGSHAVTESDTNLDEQANRRAMIDSLHEQKVNTAVTTYTVTINVASDFEIKATSMEEAVAIASNFQNQTRNETDWGDNLVWMYQGITGHSVTVSA